MKICIVGGTGNISSSITDVLLAQNHEVTHFNRGQSGTAPAAVRVIHGYRNDCAAFEQTMQSEKFDAAIDMICFNAQDAQSSVRAFGDVAHFVQCSTVCTYGTDLQLPVAETHPLRPTTDYGRGKVDADNVFFEAHAQANFPVTIIKPSTTYGPQMGLLRQIAWEFAWLDRVAKGKPIALCDEGAALHQFLHVDDAALGFAGVLGRAHCVGQTYNLVRSEAITWADYHRAAMQVLGREVEMVGIPCGTLSQHAVSIPGFDICRDIFRYDCHYSGEKIARDVPEFRPQVSLESGMTKVLEAMTRENRIPNSDEQSWEDDLIALHHGAA